MQSIRSTVTEALNGAGLGRYIEYTAPLIEALETRQSEQADYLTEAARAAGLGPVQTQSVLIEAGLLEPEPEPEPTESYPGESSLESIVQAIAADVATLMGVARERGLV